MFKFIKSWFSKTCMTPRFRDIPARNNWDGVPAENLTWDEVAKKTEEICPIIPMTLRIHPECCPKCQGDLKIYRSAYMKFDDNNGQFNVWGKYCPKGHWTHLEWA